MINKVINKEPVAIKLALKPMTHSILYT